MINSIKPILISGLLIALFLMQQSLHAQEEPQIDEGGYKLTLTEIPEVESGKVSLMSGNATVDGDKFFLEHLTMFQPVIVHLIAADPENPVRMNLAKFRYDEVAWTGETDSEGVVTHEFRTQGELKIKVVPAGKATEAPYGLMVWAADLPGPEMAPPLPIVSVEDAEESGGFYLLMKVFGGIILIGGITLIFFKLGRRS